MQVCEPFQERLVLHTVLELFSAVRAMFVRNPLIHKTYSTFARRTAIQMGQQELKRNIVQHADHNDQPERYFGKLGQHKHEHYPTDQQRHCQAFKENLLFHFYHTCGGRIKPYTATNFRKTPPAENLFDAFILYLFCNKINREFVIKM